MEPDRLWAKSWDSGRVPRAPRSAHFAEHLSDVVQTARRVIEATEDEQLRALGLSAKEYRERFRRIVLLSAAIHDLGKANDHFQGMVRRARDVRENPQGLRHEWVTILMLQHLREWLLPAVGGNDIDLAIATWAVAGHHPAADRSSPPRTSPPGAGTDITLLLGHEDYAAALAWLRSAVDVELGPAPKLMDESRPFSGAGNVFEELARWHRSAQQQWEQLKRTPDRRLVPAVKNSLIAADVAGSVLPKSQPNDPSLWDWIPKSFSARPEPGDVQAIVNCRLDGKAPRAFQADVGASQSPVTFVKAGCGSGKTVAAYMWTAANHPTRRLYFCYPTTGTATEGFKDYLFEPDGELGDLGAKLFHSRRDVDFDIILSTGKDERRCEIDEAIRIDSLEAWSTPIVACTVDTVLGIVQNNKRGMFAWPALAQSAFVFDEIHAFDDRLFGALLRFLQDLPGLPVLLMTASLPEARLAALRRVLQKRGEILAPISGPADLEQRPRYHRIEVADNDPLPIVTKTLGKVLWVCNTVGRVMDAANRAAAAGLTPLIYHSRFRYEDRVQRHKAVIDAFDSKKNASASLAICSQVAEMSLDLSADLLVTDLATVPAIIQRLGRLNRRAEDGDPTRPFVVVEPGTHLPYTPADLDAARPYTPADLDAAREWLGRLPSEAVTQQNLAEMWEQSGDHPPDLVASAWLDGGPTTTVTELREASPGISVLLDSDRSRVRATPRHIARYVLPMPPPPHNVDWKSWPRERGIPVAPDEFIYYDKLRGAEWRK